MRSEPMMTASELTMCCALLEAFWVWKSRRLTVEPDCPSSKKL